MGPLERARPRAPLTSYGSNQRKSLYGMTGEPVALLPRQISCTRHPWQPLESEDIGRGRHKEKDKEGAGMAAASEEAEGAAVGFGLLVPGLRRTPFSGFL